MFAKHPLLRIISCLIAFAFWATSFAAAEVRKALVIGNSGYEHSSKLPNTLNDSKDIAAALEKIGFSVEVKTDLPYDTMRRALRDFAQGSGDADMALVYFAGHGMELGGQNYLLPVDAQLKSDRDVAFETIPLSQMLEAVGGAKTLRLVLLDACRNNPFLAKMNVQTKSRSVANGLARVEPSGTLVSYAAKEGTTAADGLGRNSPYAEALIKHLQEPGLEIRLLFGKVRDSVIAKTGNSQEPFTYGSLGGDAIYLVPPQVEVKPEEPAQEFAIDTPVLEASLPPKFDRSQFFIEKRTGLFFARNGGVVLRQSPSALSGGLTTLSENTGYKVGERLIAKLDETPWYSLETSAGLGFVAAQDVLSEQTFRERRGYEKSIPSLDAVWEKAESENTGQFAAYWGVYGETEDSCVDVKPSAQWLVWFNDAKMNITVLANPEKTYSGALVPLKTVKGKKITREWFTFEGQDMIVSFSADSIAHDPKFTEKSVSFSRNPKCASPKAIKNAVQSNWRSLIERLPTERRKSLN